MAYRLDIEGTKISIEFDPSKKELVVRDGANPGGTFFLNEVGLAILQYWLCTIDLNSAHGNRKTLALLHQMGLEIPSGLCGKCGIPLDDCGCLSEMAKPKPKDSIEEHPPGAVEVQADCGHTVIGNIHVCPACAYKLCDECSMIHDCKSFQPVDPDESEEDDDEDDYWWNK